MRTPRTESAPVLVLFLLIAAGAPAVGAAPPRPAAAQDRSRPLPVDRTRKLIEEEAVWTVEGRVRIPRGIEVTVLRNCIIRAKGSEPAVIEVEGGFDAVGVLAKEVVFENVVVEPQAKFEKIHMDMVIFRGGGGVRTPKDASVDGSLAVENVDFLKGASFDVEFTRGSVALATACALGNSRIRTTDREGTGPSQVRIVVRGCNQDPEHYCTPHSRRVGLVGGLEVDGGDEVTVITNRLGGALAAVRNWGRKLIFDGNKVTAGKLEFSHVEAGRFPLVQCAKLDVYAAKVSATAPPKKGVRDVLTMDRCWFRGIVEPKRIFEDVILDGSDDPESNGVRVQLPKINERAMCLAGSEDK
jgi:hypothetical protein